MLDSYGVVYDDLYYLLDEIQYCQRGYHTGIYDYVSLSKHLKESAKNLIKLADDIGQIKELDSFSPDKLNRKHIYFPN